MKLAVAPVSIVALYVPPPIVTFEAPDAYSPTPNILLSKGFPLLLQILEFVG